MKLHSDSFAPGTRIPPEFAFGIPAAVGHVTLAPNRNPHLAWSEAPAGTKSFAILCHDPDAPSVGDDVNQEDRTVPASLPRVDFFHWVLVDIPPSVTEIAAGSHCEGVSIGGKPPGRAPQGLQGINDYTGWFAGDEAMKGEYAGYDGPCPPWNDSLAHRYQFTVYALDVESVGLAGSFTGGHAREAMRGHVIAEAVVVGVYALNPEVK